MKSMNNVKIALLAITVAFIFLLNSACDKSINGQDKKSTSQPRHDRFMPLAVGNYWEWECTLKDDGETNKAMCSLEIIAEENGKYIGTLITENETKSIKIFATKEGIQTDSTLVLANETTMINLAQTCRFFTNPNRSFFSGPVFATISGDTCEMAWLGNGNIFGSYHTIEMQDIYISGIGCVSMHYESSFFGSVMGFLVAGSNKFDRKLKRAIIDKVEYNF